MKTKSVLLIIVLFVGIGCATTTAPSGVLRSPDFEAQNIFGGWVELKTGVEKIDGELLAIEQDSIFLITMDNTFVSLAKDQIVSAKLTGYDMQNALASLAVFAGSVSTVSHGFYLVLTFPMWIIGGPISATSHVKSAQINYKNESDWYNMSEFARYPQGMPNLDRARLKAYNKSGLNDLSEKEKPRERSSWTSKES
ncbi:MAG: hypothetical protein ACMZ7B_10445 [Balneola sp.]